MLKIFGSFWSPHHSHHHTTFTTQAVLGRLPANDAHEIDGFLGPFHLPFFASSRISSRRQHQCQWQDLWNQKHRNPKTVRQSERVEWRNPQMILQGNNVTRCNSATATQGTGGGGQACIPMALYGPRLTLGSKRIQKIKIRKGLV